MNFFNPARHKAEQIASPRADTERKTIGLTAGMTKINANETTFKTAESIRPAFALDTVFFAILYARGIKDI